MGRRQPPSPLMITAWLLFLLPLIVRAESSREVRARAADLTYNLDHDVALQLLRRRSSPIRPIPPTIARSPRRSGSTSSSDAARYRRSLPWQLHAGRASTSVIRPPSSTRSSSARSPRPSSWRRQRVEQCSARSAGALRSRHGARAAGVLHGLGRGTADGRLQGRAPSYDEQERVLELDPQRKEAGLIVGTYRYLVSTLSLPMRSWPTSWVSAAARNAG